MTIKQRLIALLYPLVRNFKPGKRLAVGALQNDEGVVPAVPFHQLQAVKPDGSLFDFGMLQGKKTLIVNTASDCGFTPQYKELEELYKRSDNKLEILGFPSNDFAGQEPGSDEEIASFCQVNYGVSFPLFRKDSVLDPKFQVVYKWLKDKDLNGWNSQPPAWNFYKYLIDEKGVLQAVYGPEVSPLKINL
jgi:glutathione peroxidase